MKKSVVVALAQVVRKYLILLTLASTLLAIPFGYYFSGIVAASKPLISNLVVVLAVLTIYPSMIQLKTEGLLKSMRKVKEILLSLIYVFLASPLLAVLVAPTLGDPYVGVGYVAANVVPASSDSLGYVLIAEGSIELATVLAVLTLIVGIPTIPLIISVYSSSVAISVPIEPIITSLAEILLLPLLVGQLTRYALVRRKGASYVEKTIKPHLSLATMLSMLALVFVLVLNQAMAIIAKPALAILIIVYQIGSYRSPALPVAVREQASQSILRGPPSSSADIDNKEPERCSRNGGHSLRPAVRVSSSAHTYNSAGPGRSLPPGGKLGEEAPELSALEPA